MNSQPNQPEKKRLVLIPDKDFDLSSVSLQLITETDKAKTKGGQLWVVMDKNCTTVLTAPGQTKPFHTKRKKYAEYVATKYGGVAKLHREAIALVASSPCNLPRDSKRYNPDPTAPKIQLGRRG